MLQILYSQEKNLLFNTMNRITNAEATVAQPLSRAAGRTGCTSFVLDFLLLFDQAKRRRKIVPKGHKKE